MDSRGNGEYDGWTGDSVHGVPEVSLPTARDFPRLDAKTKVQDWARDLILRLNDDTRQVLLPSTVITLTPSANNNNVKIPEQAQLIALEGSSAVIAGWACGRDGKFIIVNEPTGTSNFTNEDASSEAINRIITPTGSNIGGTIFAFVYSGRRHRWLTVSFF